MSHPYRLIVGLIVLAAPFVPWLVRVYQAYSVASKMPLPNIYEFGMMAVGVALLASLAWTEKWAAGVADIYRAIKGLKTALEVSGPHLFQDTRYVNNWHFRMNVHNRGNVTAKNVQMKLRGMTSPPRSSAWQADYPYPIIQVGLTADSNNCNINKDDDAVFEAMFAWASEGKTLFVGLDTKNPGHPISIEKDERWKLDYVVTAENADPVTVALELYVENDVVVVRRRD
jgi:hypothetical protein